MMICIVNLIRYMIMSKTERYWWNLAGKLYDLCAKNISDAKKLLKNSFKNYTDDSVREYLYSDGDGKISATEILQQADPEAHSKYEKCVQFLESLKTSMKTKKNDQLKL